MGRWNVYDLPCLRPWQLFCLRVLHTYTWNQMNLAVLNTDRVFWVRLLELDQSSGTVSPNGVKIPRIGDTATTMVHVGGSK